MVSGPCALVSGATFSSSGAGTCVVKADGAATANFTAASAQQSVTIAKATPAITFGAAPTPTYLANFAVSATTTNTESSTLTYSVFSGPCELLANATFRASLGVGTCVIQANGAATTNFAATSAQQSITVSKRTPVIDFGAAPTPTYLGGDFTVSATTTNSDSGTLTYSRVSGPCALVSGATFSSSGAGTCVVQASGAATTNHNSATANQSVEIAKANQATLVAVATPSTVVYGDTSTLSSTGGSGSGAVTFGSTGSGCSITGATLSVTNASGSCAVTTTKAADTDYNAATSAALTVTLQKAEQATLTVNDPGTVTFGSTPQLTASGGSGSGALTFGYGGSTGCTVTSGGVLTVTDASGSCDITATKAADTNYNSATSAARTITLAKADQATLVAVATPSSVAYGSTSALSSTGGTGTGAVTFSSGASTGCSVTGSTLSVTNAAGSCDITATKATDTNYNATTSAPLTVSLTKAAAAITFGAAPTAAFPGAEFTVSASTTNTDSGTLTYSVMSGPCSHTSGGTFSPTGVGTCVVKADGAATNNFEAASNTQNVSITQTTYTLTVNNSGHGTVTSSPAGINCGADCTENYNAGTPVTLTATPDAGYRFTGWSGDCSGTSACSVTMDQARTETATFAANDVSTTTSGNLPAGSYNNITVDGPAVVTLTGDVDVQGCVTINNGATVVMGTFIFSGPGCFTLNPGGSLSSGSAAGITASGATGSVQVDGTRAYNSIGSYTYNGSASQAVGDGLPSSVTNLTISNTGADGGNTVTGNGGQIVTGTLHVADGVYESHSDYADVTIEAAGTLTLTGPTTVSGNWTNNGGTLSGNFPVTLDGGTGQTITGNTTFYALVKSVTAAQTLNFAAASTTSVTNSLTLNGTAGNLPSLRSTVGGTQWSLVNGDTLTTDPTCASTATVTSGVGTYPITCSGAAASSNYTISYVAGTLTITTATITITAQNKTRQYGAADPAFTFTTTGLVNGDSLTTDPTCISTATITSGVGTYPITCSGAVASSNYTISYAAGTLTITTATITITAQDKTRQYGAADPAFTFTTSGLVNGDSLTTNPTCASTATVTSGVGTYPITCSGAAASSNYTISYVAGTLTITTATITVTAQDKTRQYGVADPAFTLLRQAWSMAIL